ncbi:MAG: hypothetical protein NTY61_02930 [Candidatus Parcubacteria bacterium]|nr:hypothetical protein [Candidatus Parcubacteria bacterium]
MKTLSRLLIVVVATAIMTIGCSPWAVNTTNSPHGTSYSSNRNLPKDYIPRSFTANLEAGPDGVDMTWVGNPDSAALANLANAKAHQDQMWDQQIDRMKIENALLAQDTLPGLTGSTGHSRIRIENSSGNWAWVQTGPNSGLRICPTQTSQSLFLQPGSPLHLEIAILSGQPPKSGTPPKSMIIGSYTEDWLVPGVDHRIYLPDGSWVNGVYSITWPYYGNACCDYHQRQGETTPLWWNVLQYDRQHGY